MVMAPTALIISTAAAVPTKAAASTPRILPRRRQVLQSSRRAPIQAVTPASAASGIWDSNCVPKVMKPTRNTAWMRLDTAVLAPHCTLARLRGDPHAGGRSKGPADEVPDPVGPQFHVGVVLLHELMTAAKVFHHPRGHERIDGRDKGQAESRREYIPHIRRLPLKSHRRGQAEEQSADFLPVPSKQLAHEKRYHDSEQGSRAAGPPIHGQRGDHHDGQSHKERLHAYMAELLHDLQQLQEHRLLPSTRGRIESEDGAQLRDDHHAANSAGEPGHDGVRHFGDVAAQTQNTKGHHDDRGGNTDFRRAGDPFGTHGCGDEGNGHTGSAADQYGITAQQAQKGAEMIEVYTPIMGGSPINDASAKP